MIENYRPIIVLDDDPTGTQTVHGVPVITEWSIESIDNEFKLKTPLFYILTNSRALIAAEANELAKKIGENLKFLKQKTWIVSRGDSTLRGHFPNEIDALASGLGWENEVLIVLIPAFFEGNRFTKGDVHYLKEDGNWIPVGETPYAQDKTFGYNSSNLKDWVEEKTKGRVKATEVNSISIENLEDSDENLVLEIIKKANKILIINALNQSHLDKFSRIIKKSNRKIIFRTGASFVASFGNIDKKPILQKTDLSGLDTKNGGLIIVGSHVPKSTAQLHELLITDIQALEFEVEKYLKIGDYYLQGISKKLNAQLADKLNVVVYTSRNLKIGENEEESLKLSVQVSEGLIKIAQYMDVKPRFFIAKGGITSSDLATKGLGVKRAIVLGQIEAGIPVWALGNETKFPSLSYIIFPGNVGKDETLKAIYEKLR